MGKFLSLGGSKWRFLTRMDSHAPCGWRRCKAILQFIDDQLVRWSCADRHTGNAHFALALNALFSFASILCAGFYMSLA
jgi:hypothetical protein